jgi:hypothetical protein
MVDLDRRYFHAALFIDEARINLAQIDQNAFRTQPVVGYPDADIEIECLPQMRHHVLGARRSPYRQRPVSPAEQPAGQPRIGKPHDMVGVKMGKKYPIDVLPADLDLGETLQRAAADIEKKFLVARLDQYARSEAVHHRRRISRAKQGYADFLGRRHAGAHAQ